MRLYSIYCFGVFHVSKLTNIFILYECTIILHFVPVMVADHSALYAEKWSKRPHLASNNCGSYHVGNPVQLVGL